MIIIRKAEAYDAQGCADLSELEEGPTRTAVDFESLAEDKDIIFMLKEEKTWMVPTGSRIVAYVLGSIISGEKTYGLVQDLRVNSKTAEERYSGRPGAYVTRMLCKECFGRGAEMVHATSGLPRKPSTLPLSPHTVNARLIETKWGYAEGNIWLRAHGHRLKCFIYYGTLGESAVTEWINSRKGDFIEVHLGLGHMGRELVESGEKSITRIPMRHTPNRHEIVGEVIHRFPDRTFPREFIEGLDGSFTVDRTVLRRAVVDCGVPVHLTSGVSEEKSKEDRFLDVGDWVRTSGRMDVWIELVTRQAQLPS